MKPPFNMTISEMRDECDNATQERRDAMAAEIERRIAKRSANEKNVGKKYSEILTRLKA